jgi:hypothetical protein
MRNKPLVTGTNGMRGPQRVEDPPPADEDPEEGDRVIELVDGVPTVYTHSGNVKKSTSK